LTADGRTGGRHTECIGWPTGGQYQDKGSHVSRACLARRANSFASLYGCVAQITYDGQPVLQTAARHGFGVVPFASPPLSHTCAGRKARPFEYQPKWRWNHWSQMVSKAEKGWVVLLGQEVIL